MNSGIPSARSTTRSTRPGGTGSGDELVDQGAGVAVVEPLQLERLDRRVRRPAPRRFGTLRDDRQQRQPFDTGDQHVEHVERRWIGPVQVLDDQERRRGPGDRLDESRRSPPTVRSFSSRGDERRRAGCAATDMPTITAEPHDVVVGQVVLTSEARQRDDRVVVRGVAADVEQSAQRVGDRVVGRVLVVRRALDERRCGRRRRRRVRGPREPGDSCRCPASPTTQATRPASTSADVHASSSRSSSCVRPTNGDASRWVAS